jgi:hypothetical protein
VVGKAGGILGRLGMGQPRFGEQTKPVSRLDQAGHLGDVLHVGGAVPVVIRNMPAQATQSHINLQQLKTISIGSIGASAGPLAASPLETAISESGTSGSRFITDPSQFGSPEVAAGGLGGDGLGSSPSMLTDMFGKSLAGVGQFSPNGFPVMGDLAYGDGSPNGIFSTLQKAVGGPGGTTGFAGPVSGYGGGSPVSSGSGSVGMFGGILKGIGGLFGKGGSSAPTGEIDPETGAPLGHDIPGSANNASRKHIKKLVKEIYGMDINNAMADQIVAIAKQSFGGQHDVAVRSPQVRELLRLYAQTTGQKSAEDKFVADHA